MPRTGQLYIFGDSLSDDGASAVQVAEEPIDIFFAGRASNGLVWHENIRNGLAVAPAAQSISQAPDADGFLRGSDLNGINFAHSGAVSSSDSKPNLPGALQQAEGFAALVASGDIPAPDDQDVFVIWIGGNDLLRFGDASFLELFDLFSLGPEILENIEDTVGTLQATGAANFLIMGQPIVGGAFLGDAAQDAQLLASLWNNIARGFNDDLEDYVDDLNNEDGQSALFIDIESFIEDLQDNPAAFGFSNVTSDIFADGAPETDQSYFSVDGIHPTGAGHAAIANYVLAEADAAGFDLTQFAGNVVPGTFRDDTLLGSMGDDTFTGGLGDDEIDGADGVDTTVLSSSDTSYSLFIGDTTVTVADRSGADGTDVLQSIEMLDFNGVSFDLTLFDDAASLEVLEYRAMTEVYLSYFNRAPDALGLTFWADAQANGITLDTIADAFATSEEGLSVFPQDAQLFEFVTSVYQNALGRVGDDAGVNFWANALQSGNVGRGEFVLRVLEGARAAPPDDATEDFIAQQLADRAYLDARTDIGIYYAGVNGLSNTDNARTVMSLYDGTTESFASTFEATNAFYDAAIATDGTGEFIVTIVGASGETFFDT